ncbi:MAG: hypothetical protein QF662_03910, partial [Phycisphaerae bacterium]|nr:hypothetical protein [Phycisphaerae bacterium]
GDDSAPKPEKMVKLGLRECLELALRHNTELQVMSLAVPKQQTQIVEAEGIFDTTFFSNNLFRRTDQPSTNLSAPVLGRAS